jgi:hypothetical protein
MSTSTTDISPQNVEKSGKGRWRKFFRRSQPGEKQERSKAWIFVALIVVILLILFVISLIWGSEPDAFDVWKAAQDKAAQRNEKIVTGYVTTNTLIAVAGTLMDKPGGYLSNDILPPSVFMDNIPNWEFGVLVQVRDFAKAMRNEISRSQTQSQENEFLAKAEPQFNMDSESWIFPSAESEYREGIEALENYLGGLTDSNNETTQFFARADNLRDWLRIVAGRLGSLSQRLSASVGQQRINVNLAGDPAARESTPEPGEIEVKTPWLEIDDVFYEARGTCWALIHLLRAVEIDFYDVLQKKNALRSVQQIIRELEATQKTIWSPMILNGSEFGLLANHSLVMSSYISRANAGLIDLRNLLSQG